MDLLSSEPSKTLHRVPHASTSSDTSFAAFLMHIISTSDRKSDSSPCGFVTPVQPSHQLPSDSTSPLGVLIDNSKPPPRPPRAFRPPKQDSAPSPTRTHRRLALPSRHYCYDPFSGFEVPDSSIDSTLSRSRADSIDLDPDMYEVIAKQHKAGSTYPIQTVESYDNDDFAKPLAWLVLDNDTATYDTSLSALDASSLHQIPKCPPRRAKGALTASTSYASLVSAFSTSSKTIDASENNKLRTQPRASSFMASKMFITSALRKLSVNASSLSGISSQDSNLTMRSLWKRRTSQSFVSQPSALASSVSVTHGYDDSDSDSELEAVIPKMAFDATLPSTSAASSPRSTVSVLRQMTDKAGKEDVTTLPIATEPIPESVRQGHLSLPSYHRGLRKKMYPPRVRYEVFPATTKPPVRWQSPPASLSPRLFAATHLPSSSGPRPAFDGSRSRLL
ncbi:uncharacterized protein UBRO_00692 [Ustilago bromivora]|uniref:Uncharacterized protein n=2 Tax=Ustilago bromivora TaxID=307758 RepID=A0A1K0FX29_9BASI|nr:uncharacterized protein UBRO_00692 [Ustilago bromivora]